MIVGSFADVSEDDKMLYQDWRINILKNMSALVNDRDKYEQFKKWCGPGELQKELERLRKIYDPSITDKIMFWQKQSPPKQPSAEDFNNSLHKVHEIPSLSLGNVFLQIKNDADKVLLDLKKNPETLAQLMKRKSITEARVKATILRYIKENLPSLRHEDMPYFDENLKDLLPSETLCLNPDDNNSEILRELNQNQHNLIAHYYGKIIDLQVTKLIDNVFPYNPNSVDVLFMRDNLAEKFLMDFGGELSDFKEFKDLNYGMAATSARFKKAEIKDKPEEQRQDDIVTLGSLYEIVTYLPEPTVQHKLAPSFK